MRSSTPGEALLRRRTSIWYYGDMNNPYIRAAAASAYIGVIALFFMFAPRLESIEDTPLAPVVMLSLLTLSVSIMGFLFFYQPLCLVLDGKRTEAVRFFATTVGAFAVITALWLMVAVLL